MVTLTPTQRSLKNSSVSNLSSLFIVDSTFDYAEGSHFMQPDDDLEREESISPQQK
jgi:hypothetical protein